MTRSGLYSIMHTIEAGRHVFGRDSAGNSQKGTRLETDSVDSARRRTRRIAGTHLEVVLSIEGRRRRRLSPRRCDPRVSFAMADRSLNPADTDYVAALDATSALLGLEIEPAWREAILAHMKVIGEAAQLVQEFPLADEIEPAPVFQP